MDEIIKDIKAKEFINLTSNMYSCMRVLENVYKEAAKKISLASGEVKKHHEKELDSAFIAMDKVDAYYTEKLFEFTKSD